MADNYVLLKELAPANDSSRYCVARWDSSARTFKVLFFEDTEDKARATHHRMLFGHGDD